MMLFTRRILLLLCLFIIEDKVIAQSQIDSATISQQESEAISYYDKALGDQADLFNGKDYIAYIFKKNGNPFVDMEMPQTGWISYKNKLYQNIPMQYDISREQVIVVNSDRLSRIVPENVYIDSFGFGTHHFIYFPALPAIGIPTNGFYDRLTNGTIKVFALRKKGIREILEREYVVREFPNETKYFAYKDGKFYPMKNKQSILNLLGNKRKKVTNELNDQKINFRKGGFENALITTAHLYDEVPN